jgi:hypothetical protein
MMCRPPGSAVEQAQRALRRIAFRSRLIPPSAHCVGWAKHMAPRADKKILGLSIDALGESRQSVNPPSPPTP